MSVQQRFFLTVRAHLDENYSKKKETKLAATTTTVGVTA